jgi:hypothetical protein
MWDKSRIDIERGAVVGHPDVLSSRDIDGSTIEIMFEVEVVAHDSGRVEYICAAR